MEKFAARLLRKTALNHDVIQLDFAWSEKPVEFQAGQFFIMEVVDDLGKVNRSYSVASAPGSTEGFSLCVKLLPDGRGSNYLRTLEPGASTNFMGSFGHFVVTDSSNELALIATGTGLAPFMSMLPVLFAQPEARPITLIFGVRYEEDLFYVEQLRKWEKEHAHFKAVISLSQPGENWSGERGRVTEHLSSFDPQKVQFYICGNGDMVKAVRDSLLEKNAPKENIHLEQFTTL